MNVPSKYFFSAFLALSTVVNKIKRLDRFVFSPLSKKVCYIIVLFNWFVVCDNQRVKKLKCLKLNKQIKTTRHRHQMEPEWCPRGHSMFRRCSLYPWASRTGQERGLPEQGRASNPCPRESKVKIKKYYDNLTLFIRYTNLNDPFFYVSLVYKFK